MFELNFYDMHVIVDKLFRFLRKSIFDLKYVVHNINTNRLFSLITDVFENYIFILEYFKTEN